MTFICSLSNFVGLFRSEDEDNEMSDTPIQKKTGKTVRYVIFLVVIFYHILT